MTDEAPKHPKLSRTEHARQIRRAAYLKAKARRANDPRLIAIMESVKRRRRETYQAAKERRKAAIAEEKAKQRAAKDATIRDPVRPRTKPA